MILVYVCILVQVLIKLILAVYYLWCKISSHRSLQSCTCWLFLKLIIPPSDTHTGGNGAIVSFPDKDERVSEDISQAKIPVQVDGKDGGNFTLIVTPLTVAQYQAQSNQYGSICDSVLDANLDTAEGNLLCFCY